MQAHTEPVGMKKDTMRAEAQVWKDGLLESNDKKEEQEEPMETDTMNESDQKLVAVVIPQRHRKRNVLRISTLAPGSSEWVMSASDVSIGTKSGSIWCIIVCSSLSYFVM